MQIFCQQQAWEAESGENAKSLKQRWQQRRLARTRSERSRPPISNTIQKDAPRTKSVSSEASSIVS